VYVRQDQVSSAYFGDQGLLGERGAGITQAQSPPLVKGAHGGDARLSIGTARHPWNIRKARPIQRQPKKKRKGKMRKGKKEKYGAEFNS